MEVFSSLLTPSHPLLANSRLKMLAVSNWKSMNLFLKASSDICAAEVYWGTSIGGQEKSALIGSRHSDLSLIQLLQEAANGGFSLCLRLKDREATLPLIHALRRAGIRHNRLILTADVLSFPDDDEEPSVELTDLKQLRDAFPSAACGLAFAAEAKETSELKIVLQEISRCRQILGGAMTLFLPLDLASSAIDVWTPLNRDLHFILYGRSDPDGLHQKFTRSLLLKMAPEGPISEQTGQV